MGLSMLSLLLAVQHGVSRAYLGIATSLNQFSRSVGAAVGVAGMGALMTRRLAGVALPDSVASLESLAATGATLTGVVRLEFAAALHEVFVAGAVLAAASLLATFFLPPVSFAGGVPPAAGEQILAAEMASLGPEDEPLVVGKGKT
jgi:hypothetical protein